MRGFKVRIQFEMCDRSGCTQRSVSRIVSDVTITYMSTCALRGL